MRRTAKEMFTRIGEAIPIGSDEPADAFLIALWFIHLLLFYGFLDDDESRVRI